MNTPYRIAYVMQVAAVAAGLYTVGCMSDAYQKERNRSRNGYMLVPSSAYHAAVWIERERRHAHTMSDRGFLRLIGENGLDLVTRYPLTSHDLMKSGVLRLHARKSPFMACVQYAIQTMCLPNTVSPKRYNVRPETPDHLVSTYCMGSDGIKNNIPFPISRDISSLPLNGAVQSLCLSAADFIANGPETMSNTQSILIGSMARMLWGTAMQYEADERRPYRNGFSILSTIDKAGWHDMNAFQLRVLQNIKAMGDIVHALKTVDDSDFEGLPYQNRNTRISAFLTGDIIHVSVDEDIRKMQTDGFISGFAGNRIIITGDSEHHAQCRIPSISTGIRWGAKTHEAFL